MIRVDAVRRMDVVYDEISEALGEEEGYFDAAEFEENMSTHYGRMIHEDDRTIMFANPEDAAEYIGFDLRLQACPTTRGLRLRRPCTRRTARSTSSSTATCTTGTRARTTGCRAQEQYAKGWIECFHAYQGLGPAETHWPIEQFQKYSEDDLMKDVFEDGYVDVAIFQPTYLKRVVQGRLQHHRAQRARWREKHPGKFIVNTRWDPRDGDAGLKKLAENVARWGSKGVKLYTAEWHEGSRGWTLKDPEAYRYLEKCQELGIKNIHVHKGPTIWPLDKDAFDVSDVDHAATDFPELNFIVEHVGLPRIEDFCFMATQEPNVYAGLSVVIGGLMHARPRFFAKVMGELLFWVGEDKMTFGSDYGIWEPKWQVEGFVDWDYPSDEFSDYPRVTPRPRRRSSASTPPSCTASRCRPSASCRRRRRPPAAQDDAAAGRRHAAGATVVTATRLSVLAALGTVRDPELDEPVTDARLRRVVHRVRRRGRRGAPAAADVLLRAQLRVPDGRRRLRRGVRRGRRAPDRGGAGRPLRRGRDQRRGGGAGRLRRLVRRRGGRRAGRPAGRLPAQGRAGRHRPGVPAAARRGRAAGELAGLTLGDVPPSPALDRLRRRRAELGLPAGDDAPLLVDAAHRRAGRARRCRCTCAGPADPDQPGGQHRHLPRHAAAPLRPPRTD